MHWKPEKPGTYNIYAMAVGSVGHTGDHYTISEPFEFELSEEQLAQFASPNAAPTLRLVTLALILKTRQLPVHIWTKA